MFFTFCKKRQVSWAVSLSLLHVPQSISTRGMAICWVGRLPGPTLGRTVLEQSRVCQVLSRCQWRRLSHSRGGMSISAVAAVSSEVGHQHQQEQQEQQNEYDASAKTTLRQQIKRQLKSLSHESTQQQSQQIEQHVLQSCFFQQANSVGLYITCERLREVDTAALLEQALQHGKQVFVPLVEDSSSNMSLLHIDTLQDLTPAPPFGILEPSRTHPDGSPRTEVLQAPYQLDLLLMPGLGFDETGARLGRGGGYYDKLVHHLDDRAKQQHWHRPWLVALAFREQLVPYVPMDWHDRHVDVLATPDGLVLCTDRARSHLQHLQS